MYKTISCVRRYFIKFHEGQNMSQIFRKDTEPARLDIRPYVGRKKILISFTKWATLDPRGPDFWPVGRRLGNQSLRYMQNTYVRIYNLI